MSHKYQIRQSVRLVHGLTVGRGGSAPEVWEISRLLPADQTGEPAYRVKTPSVERVVLEHELEAA